MSSLSCCKCHRPLRIEPNQQPLLRQQIERLHSALAQSQANEAASTHRATQSIGQPQPHPVPITSLDQLTESFVFLPQQQTQTASTQQQQRNNQDSATAKSLTGLAQGTIDQQLHSLSELWRLVELPPSASHPSAPLCLQCSDNLLASQESKLEASQQECDAYKEQINRLTKIIQQKEQQKEQQKTQVSSAASSSGASADESPSDAAEIAELDSREAQLLAQLNSLQSARESAQAKVNELLLESSTLSDLEHRFWCEYSDVTCQVEESAIAADTTRIGLQYERSLLSAIQQVNVFDQVFHISSSGHFGCINGFRLGRLASVPVEWSEINAALGEICLLITAVSRLTQLNTGKYRIHPLGSFSKISKRDEPNSACELFGTSELSLGRIFWSRRFDTALTWLLATVFELGEQAHARDASFSPHKYEINLTESLIGGLPLRMQFTPDVKWTRACKYLLTNLKFLLVWTSQRAS